MGRYCSLSFKDAPKPKKLYFVCQSLSLKNQQQTKAMLHYYDKLSSNDYEFDTKFKAIDNEEQLGDAVSVVVRKETDPLGLSAKLAGYVGAKLSDPVVVLEGPFGYPFPISPSSGGEYVIIAEGTGIFKYLDFLYLVFKKVSYEYFQKWSPQVAS